jgi:alcohol dehydrogenase
MKALVFQGLRGDVPSCRPGGILGHEGIGVVEAVGPAVAGFKPGDRGLISCISACGRCNFCRKAMHSHCTTGGWILGNRIDGTQAEWVRIPHADSSLHGIPAGADEEAMVMLSDILPIGFECGVLNDPPEGFRTYAQRGTQERTERKVRNLARSWMQLGRDARRTSLETRYAHRTRTQSAGS